MPSSTIRGAALHHSTSGAGQKVIWGHGLSQSRAAEDESPIVDWSRIDARTTRYDARGHGFSSSTRDQDGYSWEALALDQLGLADALGVDHYIAGGASMGCGTALYAAALAPQRIDALVLVIPPTAWETRSAQASMWNTTADVVLAKGVEPIIAAGADIAPPDPFVGDVARKQRREAELRAWDTTRLAQVFRGATKANLPDRDQIAAISVPTLILAWTGDPTHPVSTAEELHRLIAGSELHLASSSDEYDGWTDRVSAFVGAL
ncbi:MAG: 3-oxoadipate enol-lactonase [Candidatus Poriferisodalaceae bacterium]|jgi:3-oxoadipate enol-lactonase